MSNDEPADARLGAVREREQGHAPPESCPGYPPESVSNAA